MREYDLIETDNGFIGGGQGATSFYRPILKFFGIAAIALSLGACAQLKEIASTFGGEHALGLFEKAVELEGKVEDATLGNGAKAVYQYCDKVPVASRKLLRERFNARDELQGAEIGVYCPEDDPLTLPAPAE